MSTIDRLCLGTAQFGMSYGVRPLGRPAIKPSEPEVDAMLRLAVAAGIPWIDTAAAYGDAEDRVGRCKSVRSTRIATKLRPNLYDELTGAELRNSIQEEAHASAKRLGRDRLDVFLLHSARYAFRRDILDALRLVAADRVGVSCYEPEEARFAIANGMTAIQVPYNVFDRRFEDVFEMAVDAGVMIFARQPFLQSILLLKPEELPEHLSHAREVVTIFRQMCEARDVTPLKAALMFALAAPLVDYVVFGVENAEQLEQVLELAGADRLFDLELLTRLEVRFAELPAAIVNPSRWAQAQTS